MIQASLNQRSRLVPTGLVLTGIGAVGFLVARLWGRQIEATSEFLLLAVISLALGLFFGPVIWLVGLALQRRGHDPNARASLRIWLPLALAAVPLNFYLGFQDYHLEIPPQHIAVFLSSQVLLLPGTVAALSLVFRSGRCAGRVAKVFAIASLLLACSYLSRRFESGGSPPEKAQVSFSSSRTRLPPVLAGHYADLPQRRVARSEHGAEGGF